MEIALRGEPYPKQIEFFTAREKFIAYGGSRGGGKSFAARRKALLLSLNTKYSGMQILFLRRRYNDLYENHIFPLMLELKDFVKYNSQTKSFDFPWGTRLIFGYCDHENDVLNFQGKAYDCIFIEEATQMTAQMIQAFTENLRPSGMMKYPREWKPRMYFTCNPGGVGHAYIKRLFIDRRFQNKEKPEDYRFIPSTVFENKYIMETDPSYVELLENLPEQRRRAMLYGDWDVYEGQFFSDFRNNPEGYGTRKFTHVIADFKIPDSWQRYRVMDWGYAKPFSVAWYACDGDGALYRYREWYGCTGEPDVGIRLTPEMVAEHIKAIEETLEPDVYIEGIADPAIFKSETGKSIAETFEDCGVYFEPADNSRLTGWAQVHERLKFDEEGLAMLYIFESCVHAIRTLPILIHDKTRVEDLDTTLEDHIADEIRYMCMARVIRTRPVKVDRSAVAAFNPFEMPKRKDNYYGLGVYIGKS